MAAEQQRQAEAHAAAAAAAAAQAKALAAQRKATTPTPVAPPGHAAPDQPGARPMPDPGTPDPGAGSPTPGAGAAIAAAQSALGVPYVWAGAGPTRLRLLGPDDVGLGAGRAQPAALVGRPVLHDPAHRPEPTCSPVTSCSSTAHRPRGLYIGGGMMIHAPHAGDVVQVASIYYWIDPAGRSALTEPHGVQPGGVLVLLHGHQDDPAELAAALRRCWAPARWVSLTPAQPHRHGGGAGVVPPPTTHGPDEADLAPPLDALDEMVGDDGRGPWPARRRWWSAASRRAARWPWRWACAPPDQRGRWAACSA